MKTDKVIYRTKTREEFDWLMQKLEKEGCKWASGKKPTKRDRFGIYTSETYIFVDNKELTYGNREDYKLFHEGNKYIKISDIRREKMEEEKNIIKNVLMAIGDMTIRVYMSMETLNKIKNGEYKYPFIQYTDGETNYYYRLDQLSYIFAESEEYILIDELENRMWSYLKKKEPFPFRVMVDDNTGF